MASTRIILRNPSGYRGPKGDKGDPGAAGGGGAGQGVPTGGTTEQILSKIDGTNYNTHWVDKPTGSGTGLPTGGTTGQALTKNSSTNGDAGWSTLTALSSSTPAALGTAAVGSGTTSARADHVHAMPRLDQVGAPTANVALGSHKLTGVQDGTADTDAATVGQMNDADDAKQDVSTLLDAILTVLPGLTITVDYDATTSSWPSIDVSLTGDARVSFLFRGSDESDPPPTVSGKSTWVRPVS